MGPQPERFAEHAEMLVNRIRKNRRRLKGWLKQRGVSCCRLYDREIPELPLTVDWYEGRLHVAMFPGPQLRLEEGYGAWLEQLVAAAAAALGVDRGATFVKEHYRQRGGTQQGGAGRSDGRFTVGEGGHRFLVDLAGYLDTGLFLDHRTTRRLVREEARGRRVLNLFGYTGSFSVYAAAGGAASTTTVDLSNTYLDWAQENMALNGFDGPEHRFVRDDALGALTASDPSAGERYDLVILDPPTVSKSKAMPRDLDVQRDHPALLRGVARRCRPGAVVYFSTNLTSFKLHDAGLPYKLIEEITDRTAPFDFRGPRPHRCWRMVVS